MVVDYWTGEYTVAELAEQHGVGRATVYRALDRAKAKGDASLALSFAIAPGELTP